MKSLSQSPIEFSFVQSPYEFYAEARSCGDLIYWKDYDRICAVSYKAVNHFLRDRRWGREIPIENRTDYESHLEPYVAFESCSMLELDPPAHTRLRKLVSRAFTSRSIAALAPYIQELTDSILDDLEGDEFELIGTLAESLPASVISRLLGIPTDMTKQLLSWSHDMVAIYQAKRDRAIEIRTAKATEEFSDYISEQVSSRMEFSGDDLISRLVNVSDEGQKLTLQEKISTCILLLNAGHEATANTIGNGVKLLVDSDFDHGTVFSEKNLLCAVEEILRFDPPLHMFERYAKCDMIEFGHEFKKGDTVGLVLASANRDERVFEEADIFNPMRRRKANVSFGAGVHFCVGAPLARLEIQIALPSLFRRFPKLRFSRPPIYANQYHFHGFEELWASA